MAKNQLQSDLFQDKLIKEFGGSLRKGKRKLARPIATKKPMHLVLRAQIFKSEWNLLSSKHRNQIENLVHQKADDNGIKIDQFANVGNHIHMIVISKTRDGFKRFLRTITGRIAAIVTGAKKGKRIQLSSQKRGACKHYQRKFWLGLAFTRVLEWGVDLFNTRHYITKNKFEGEGVHILTTRGYRTFQIREGTLRSLPSLNRLPTT